MLAFGLFNVNKNQKPLILEVPCSKIFFALSHSFCCVVFGNKNIKS
jgi:hypothetical protein